MSLGELFSAFACVQDDPPCVDFQPRFYSFIVFVMLFAAGFLALLRASFDNQNVALPGVPKGLEALADLGDLPEDEQPRCELIDLPGTDAAAEAKRRAADAAAEAKR